MKKMIIRNDGGVWGEDPSDVNLGDVVLRSTEQTEGGSWKIEDPAMRVLSATDKKKSLLKEGDLLITKSSGSSNHIGKTTMVDKTVAQMNACYSNFMQRIRVNKLGHSKFIYYFMNSTLAREQFVFLSKSTTGLANLSAETINQLLLCVPAKEEQMSIALSLDNKTSLIDREIALIEYKISLLQEQRKAIIFEAVTGKIDLSNYEPKESLESN